MIHDPGISMICCGENREELVPNTVEASGEKHLPAATIENGSVTVNVGSIDYPMLPAHLIEWVYVKAEKGGQRKVLKSGEDSKFSLCLGDDKSAAVYAYCNLHGLWMTEV